MTRTRLVRDLSRLADETFDLAVIGAGITGACIARDAARRGLSVALIDKGDFSGGTSGASSKLIHGGLRYLKRLELRLVREALRERRIWAINAPHLVRPMPFLLPLGDGAASRAERRAAIALYDLLAFDRARVADPEQRAQRHYVLDGAAARELEPSLGPVGAGGALVYYDYQAESPERLALECVMDAAAHGACTVNYVAMTGSLGSGTGPLVGIAVEDRIRGAAIELRARLIVNATGPWADRCIAQLGSAPSFTLARSKGIHLITRALLEGHAVALPGRGEHLFVVPWRSRTIIGTTDTLFEGDPEDVGVSAEEEADLLGLVRRMLPGAGVSSDDVVYRYAGLRPLIRQKDGSGDTYALSREARIVEHGETGGPANLISAIGGKWTTARLVAERTVDRAGARLGVRLPRSDTATARLPLAPPAGLAEHRARGRADLAGLDQDVTAQLLSSYGTAAGEVARTAEGDPGLLRRIAPDVPHVAAEAVYAAREEMALTGDDILLRRTSIAHLGGATATVRKQVELALR